MRQTWQCDYCNKTFPTKEEAIEHEKRCGKNPENKITDPTIFRLSMILDGLRDDLPFLICEVERAGTNNCPYMIYEQRYRMIDCLQKAQGIASRRKTLKTTKLQDIEKHYPELLTAILDTLKRPAFNEW